jgi:glycosyltransferase involved in cell wall biosynthesis
MAGDASPTVLHYTGYDDDRGGIVTIIRHLAAAGGDCRLGLNPGAVQTRIPPLPVLELPWLEGEHIGLANAWRARQVARAVQAWLRAGPGRIFHGHSRAGLLVALWLHAGGERRVVASVHCYGRQRWFYRWAARRLGTRLFWLSPAMKSHYGAGEPGWAQCIPGGVPPSAVVPATPQPGRLRLGGVGALVPWKNWAVVIEALARLPAARRAAVRFTHIGAGPDRDALRRLAQRHGVEGQVEFRGAESTADRLLGTIDALVVASRNEPFSLAVLEALAAGVPVIAADSGGTVDQIRPGVNGELYPTGDAAGLAALLARWVAQPPAWDRAAIRASTVPIDRVAAQWAEVYAGLLAGERSGQGG